MQPRAAYSVASASLPTAPEFSSPALAALHETFVPRAVSRRLMRRHYTVRRREQMNCGGGLNDLAGIIIIITHLNSVCGRPFDDVRVVVIGRPRWHGGERRLTWVATGKGQQRRPPDCPLLPPVAVTRPGGGGGGSSGE